MTDTSQGSESKMATAISTVVLGDHWETFCCFFCPLLGKSISSQAALWETLHAFSS